MADTAAAKAVEILDAAEQLVRTQGYNGFSFRDLAARVGIRSASVHYHFPTKADLGVAVARRYTERFLEGLGDPADPAARPHDLLVRYVAAYRRAVIRDGQMCLCGLLGAEVASLPDDVAAEARRFFERNIGWLEAVLSRLHPDGAGDREAAIRRRALRTLATLEGAMILTRTLGRAEVFDRAVEDLSAPGPLS